MNKIPFPKSRIRQAAGAFSLLLNPSFFLRFSVQDYLASQGRPYGWWVWFPRLHYCFFNAPSDSSAASSIRIVDRLDPAKKTVLFVSHEASRSGAPILLLNLMNKFREEYNVALICLEGGGIVGNFIELASYFEPPPPGLPNASNVIKTQLARLLKKTEIAFSIVNTLDAAQALRHLCKHGVASIHLVHEFPIHPGGRWGLKVSSLYADATVYSSRLLLSDAAKKYALADNPKSRVIPQGIFHPSCETNVAGGGACGTEDLRTFLRKDLPHDALLVIGGGTVDYRKGVDLFLSCARKTIDRMPEKMVRFAWIGWGFHGEGGKPYPAFVRDQVVKHGLGEYFLALDEVKDFRKACEAADIFLLPSRLDPLPVVGQIAMDCGLPFLCFRGATGMAEFLDTDSDAAFGACPYMDVQAMVDKLVELLSDEALRKRVGGACARTARTMFSSERYIEQLKELAQEVERAKIVEHENARIINTSGLFNAKFSLSGKRSSFISPVTSFLCSWKSGINLKKPAPGFHPGIYAESYGVAAVDSFAHYLKSGSPGGEWSLKVIAPARKVARHSRTRVALQLHLYYHQHASTLLKRISRSRTRPDLFISVPEGDAMRDVDSLLKGMDFTHVIRSVPNRGRDIGPLFTEFRDELQEYDIIGHAHTKESLHQSERWYIERWSRFLYENVLGGKYPMIDAVMAGFEDGTDLGLVFPDDPHVIGWDENLSHAEALALRMGLSLPLPENINFPVGTMFWARSKALQPLFDLKLGWSDYPEEPLPIDGSMLHAIERLLPSVVRSTGYRCAVTHIPGISR
jgi:glycosyltransferase involved in cell wall biosynthesis